MHPKHDRAQQVSREVIGAAIEVHRILGPGLLESIYEKCLRRELELRGFHVLQQDEVRIEYKGFEFVEQLRFDLLIEDCLLVEVKAVQETLPIHKAQLLSYMKLLDIPLGLLMNFHSMKLVDGVSRMILKDSEKGEFEQKHAKDTKDEIK
jgi:GxxExxY protein